MEEKIIIIIKIVSRILMFSFLFGSLYYLYKIDSKLTAIQYQMSDSFLEK